jgi:hypothetical protein
MLKGLKEALQAPGLGLSVSPIEGYFPLVCGVIAISHRYVQQENERVLVMVVRRPELEQT